MQTDVDIIKMISSEHNGNRNGNCYGFILVAKSRGILARIEYAFIYRTINSSGQKSNPYVKDFDHLVPHGKLRATIGLFTRRMVIMLKKKTN